MRREQMKINHKLFDNLHRTYTRVTPMGVFIIIIITLFKCCMCLALLC